MITDWDKIINRIKSEVAQKLGNTSTPENGIVLVRLTAMLDHRGNPTIWTVESKSIEPKLKARLLLTETMAEAFLDTY